MGFTMNEDLKIALENGSDYMGFGPFGTEIWHIREYAFLKMMGLPAIGIRIQDNSGDIYLKDDRMEDFFDHYGLSPKWFNEEA